VAAGEAVSFEDDVVAALTSVRYHVSQEGPLHDAIARVLASNGIEAEHEVKLGPRERIDFLVGDVGIEIKMRGTVSKIAAQLWRYAKSPRVRVLLLATTRASYVELDGVEWYGKRVRVVRLPGGLI
jgi:hypothetical protein